MAIKQVESDVCIVGAGFAGLTAARRLAAEGKAVVVLEARDRVGGRSWSQTLSDGTTVDRGGAWLASGHDHMFGLARELGVETYKTWVKGSHLLVGGGQTRRYKGLIPKISPLAVLAIARAQMRTNRLAKQVPLDRPWDAKPAQEWDRRSVASWVQQSGIRSGVGHDLFEMAVRGLFAIDLEEVSLLNLLFLVHSHGSIDHLFSIENGSQENLVEGGAGGIAVRLAAGLGDAVHLNAPVRSITQRDGGVAVRADGVHVSAARAVVATPPALTTGIDFDPVLPEDRQTLYRSAVAGQETKILAVYDQPFWRDDGFSGQSAGAGTASEVTIDSSPLAGTPGVLASFAFASVAVELNRLPAAERRSAVLKELAARFGPKAATPVGFVETSWWDEEWSRGCSMAHFPPGIITRYAHLLREPFGRVHWAGTETATIWHGAMDGAVQSGERAAAEVLSAS